MLNFEHTKLIQPQFEELAEIFIQFKQCYATSKFDGGNSKVELNLPLKATAILRNNEPPEYHYNYKTKYNTF